MTVIPKPHRKKFYQRWWFWLLVIIVLIIVLSTIAGIVSYKTAQLAQYNHLKEAVTVEKRDLQRTITTNGFVVPEEVAQISFSLPATVDEVNVQIGDSVSKDEVLAKAGNQQLKAPFDGRIIDVKIFKGAAVTPSVPAIEIGYNTSKIEFLASDSEVTELSEGQDVKITIPSNDNGKEEYAGEVSFVGVKKQLISTGVTQSVETGYQVEVVSQELPNEFAQLSGLSVDIEIIVDKKHDALSIAIGAIQYDENDEPFVYLIPQLDESFVKRAKEVEDVTDALKTTEVKTGFEGDEYIEITDGLKDGEEVLLYVPVSSALPF